MGSGSTAAAASPQVTAVGLLGGADPTTLPPAAMMLTVYVSPDGWVDSTAKAPVRGTGDAAGAPGADAAAVGGREPAGEGLWGEPAPAGGAAPPADHGTPPPPIGTAPSHNH